MLTCHFSVHKAEDSHTFNCEQKYVLSIRENILIILDGPTPLTVVDLLSMCNQNAFLKIQYLVNVDTSFLAALTYLTHSSYN